MFEIVLKQDYEDFYFFRDFEVNGVVTNNTARTSRHQRTSKTSQELTGGSQRFDSPDRTSMLSAEGSGSKSRNGMNGSRSFIKQLSHGQFLTQKVEGQAP